LMKNSEAKEKIKDLDLRTKAGLVTGKDFWHTAECGEIGLKSVFVADGPNGMRVQDKGASHLGMGGSLPSTCFPTASALACSFDEGLAIEVGRRIGEEAAALGVSMVLGPGLNIKRSPLCGRNFEYYSEDCYLSGKMAAGFIKGVQSTGVSSCVKHFAANNREYARFYYDSRVDEQTLREVYLTGFEIAVKEGAPGGVMTAYNKLNGVPCSESKALIGGILRTEWGYDGLTVSDWGGTFNRPKSLEAGCDLEMPGCAFSADEIVKSVEEGKLDEKYLDESAERIYDFAAKSERIERNKADFGENARFAERAAESCLVLLKNKRSALPLKQGERVAVIGDFAKNPRFQGAGSSLVNCTSHESILDKIGGSGLNFVGYCGGYKRGGGRSGRLKRSAIKLAKKADTVIYFLGLDERSESEGVDRKLLKLNENQIALLKELTKLNKKIVAVLNCGSCVLTDWDVYVNALLHINLSGQGVAEATLNALCGKVNPSGKLAESYPEYEGQEGCAQIYSSHALKMDYAEGLFVGYRYYTAIESPVKYPFGYGLSYTTFDYSECSIDKSGVRFKIKNTGLVPGAAVPQVYVRAPRDLEVSPRELKLFKKIYLEPKEEKEIFLPFNEYSFRVWDTQKSCFVCGGDYEVSLNADCMRAVCKKVITLGEEDVPKGCAYLVYGPDKIGLKEYFGAHITEDLQPAKPYRGMPATDDMPVVNLRYCKGLLAKIYGIIIAIMQKSKNPVVASASDWMPLRSFLQFMGYNSARKEGFILACNGHFFKGIKKIIRKK